jgi:DNA replicative helicase MCM subunit Mcm2 (Cdc46/Mcm family)
MLFKEIITVEIVEDVIKFYQECMATLGMNVEKGITQFDLRGHSTNKDSYFQDVFRELASDDEQGHVSITTLAEELQKNINMFNSDQSVASYVEKRKQSGWLFEPKLGELKRQ